MEQKAQERTSILSANHIILVILLGTAGLVGSIKFLFSEIRLNPSGKQLYTVTDHRAGGPVIVDTFTIAIRHKMHAPAGEAMVAIADRDWDYRTLYLTHDPAFLVWIALISVMVSVSFALFPITVGMIREIKDKFGLQRRQLLTAVMITILIGASMAWINKNREVLVLFEIMKKTKILLAHPDWVNVHIIIGMVTGLTCITGQLMIGQATYKLASSPVAEMDGQELKDRLSKFIYLKARLKFFLMADASLIVFSILTTDTLKRSVNNEISFPHHKSYDLVPQEFVYLYGMVFTLFLALMYLPISYQLRTTGEAISQAITGEDDGSKKLKEGFQITESALESFRVALSILAPVVSALLPGIIKIG